MKHLTKIKLLKISSHQLNCNGQVSIIKLNSRDCNPKIRNPGLVYNPESEIPGLTWLILGFLDFTKAIAFSVYIELI